MKPEDNSEFCPDCGADGSECSRTACGIDCPVFDARDPSGHFCGCDQCYRRRRRLEAIHAEAGGRE